MLEYESNNDIEAHSFRVYFLDSILCNRLLKNSNMVNCVIFLTIHFTWNLKTVSELRIVVCIKHIKRNRCQIIISEYP